MNEVEIVAIFVKVISFAVPWVAVSIVVYMFYKRLKDEPVFKKILEYIAGVFIFIIAFFGKKKKKEDDF